MPRPSAGRTAARPSPPISGTSAVSRVGRLPVLGPAGDGPVPATPAGVPAGVPGALPAGVPPGRHRRQGGIRRSAAPWRLAVAPNSSANAGHQQLPASRRWLDPGIRHQLTQSSVPGHPYAFPFPFHFHSLSAFCGLCGRRAFPLSAFSLSRVASRPFRVAHSRRSERRGKARRVDRKRSRNCGLSLAFRGVDALALLVSERKGAQTERDSLRPTGRDSDPNVPPGLTHRF